MDPFVAWLNEQEKAANIAIQEANARLSLIAEARRQLARQPRSLPSPMPDAVEMVGVAKRIRAAFDGREGDGLRMHEILAVVNSGSARRWSKDTLRPHVLSVCRSYGNRAGTKYALKDA